MVQSARISNESKSRKVDNKAKSESVRVGARHFRNADAQSKCPYLAGQPVDIHFVVIYNKISAAYFIAPYSPEALQPWVNGSFSKHTFHIESTFSGG
jgi:hypothetical protein